MLAVTASSAILVIVTPLSARLSVTSFVSPPPAGLKPCRFRTRFALVPPRCDPVAWARTDAILPGPRGARGESVWHGIMAAARGVRIHIRRGKRGPGLWTVPGDRGAMPRAGSALPSCVPTEETKVRPHLAHRYLRRRPRLAVRKPWRTTFPLPTCPKRAHCSFGHGRPATTLPLAAPEAEVKCCEILTQLLARRTLTGKGVTLDDGSTAGAGTTE